MNARPENKNLQDPGIDGRIFSNIYLKYDEE
jgi:hypothetical protein